MAECLHTGSIPLQTAVSMRGYALKRRYRIGEGTKLLGRSHPEQRITPYFVRVYVLDIGSLPEVVQHREAVTVGGEQARDQVIHPENAPTSKMCLEFSASLRHARRLKLSNESWP